MKKINKNELLNKEMMFQELDDYMTSLNYYPTLDEEIKIVKGKNMVCYIHSENMTEVHIYFIITENNEDKRNFKLKILFVDDSMERKMLNQEDIYTLSNIILDKITTVREAGKIFWKHKESRMAIEHYIFDLRELMNKVFSLLKED